MQELAATCMPYENQPNPCIQDNIQTEVSVTVLIFHAMRSSNQTQIGL